MCAGNQYEDQSLKEQTKASGTKIEYIPRWAKHLSNVNLFFEFGFVAAIVVVKS